MILLETPDLLVTTEMENRYTEVFIITVKNLESEYLVCPEDIYP